MKGIPGLPGNMKDLMKQAQKMREQLEAAQQTAEAATAEGSAGGGMVKAIVNGKMKLLSLTIQRDVVNPDDVEMLQDLICAAINEAVNRAQAGLKAEMAKVTGGLDVPGL